MSRRINVLGDSVDHVESLRGTSLAAEEDEELQEIVGRAAKLLSTPIALVTLVLRRTQFFRAYHGLPPDLSATRATDWDASFCQFVVESGKNFVVTNAGQDERVPTELVERYNIQAYLGCPVTVGEHVVGSLCVIDVVPREFSPSAIESLSALATQASVRLNTLAESPSPESKRNRLASAPAFGEIRNALTVMYQVPTELKQIAIELECVTRLSDPSLSSEERERAAGSLTGARLALGDLRELGASVSRSMARVMDGLGALEALLHSRSNAHVANSIHAANSLAHHVTKLVGGVRWSPVDPTLHGQVPQSVVIASVAAVLCELASINASGTLTGELVADSDRLAIRMASGGTTSGQLEAAAERLTSLVKDEPSIAIESDGEAIRVVFPIASD